MLQQTISQPTPENVLERLDKIAAELQVLRQAVTVLQEEQLETPKGNIVMELYGALGQGTKDEYDSQWLWLSS